MTASKAILVALTLTAVAASAATSSPYVGEEARSIKSLSEADVADLHTGNGAGFAKTAELNGYPGPAHVLESADDLHLSAAQRVSTQELLRDHELRARELGGKVLDAERALEEAFASHTVDEQSLDALTSAVARYRGELRAEHLRTHLAQTAVLSPEQIRRYALLRGYGAKSDSTAHHH